MFGTSMQVFSHLPMDGEEKSQSSNSFLTTRQIIHGTIPTWDAWKTTAA